MKDHKCKFVPVGVTFKYQWVQPEQSVPKYVILACACGNVKMMRATLVTEELKN